MYASTRLAAVTMVRSMLTWPIADQRCCKLLWLQIVFALAAVINTAIRCTAPVGLLQLVSIVGDLVAIGWSACVVCTERS